MDRWLDGWMDRWIDGEGMDNERKRALNETDITDH